MADRICTRINAPASQCREHNLHCGAPRCFAPAPMPNDTLTAVANELSLFATGKLDEGSEAFFREALQVALERTRTALAKQARPEPVNDLPAPPGPATITPSPTGGNP